MAKPGIDVAALAIDELGRTVLPDELLDQIEACESLLSAGANLSCPGGTNGGCSNGSCGNSTNGFCTNSSTCFGAMTVAYCVDGPIE
jgi:hypothetical protein